MQARQTRVCSKAINGMDIYEARLLTDAAKRYKVVIKWCNQGASGDGVRQLREWYDADIIGDVHTVYIWTDRPVWPQGVPWPSQKSGSTCRA